MLKENVANLKKNIELVGGHNVTVVAATKMVAPEVISLLPGLGITIAGENRVQELLAKYDKVSGITWHFIGRLQRNKVKYIVDKVELIHSVDSEALADEINKQCAKIGKIMDVLVEINMGEEAKGGVAREEAKQLCSYISGLSNLRLKGIMCVLPKDAPQDMYDLLGKLHQDIKNDFKDADILSAGMSGDYQRAILGGANMIRPGSCLFGQRVY